VAGDVRLQVETATLAQPAQLSTSKTGGRGHQQGSGVLGAPRLLGGLDQCPDLGGVAMTGASFGMDGGSAHCAGFDSRQPHRHA
jgi:hypothetical protein